MRRVQMSKHQGRREDPAPVLPVDPRDPDILRAKRLRTHAEAAKQPR
jgi:hypothetical protein